MFEKPFYRQRTLTRSFGFTHDTLGDSLKFIGEKKNILCKSNGFNFTYSSGTLIISSVLVDFRRGGFFLQIIAAQIGRGLMARVNAHRSRAVISKDKKVSTFNARPWRKRGKKRVHVSSLKQFTELSSRDCRVWYNAIVLRFSLSVKIETFRLHNFVQMFPSKFPTGPT